MASSGRPTVSPVTLVNAPALKVPSLEDLAAQAAKENGGSPLLVAPDVNQSWSTLQWVLGHGLPSSLRRAQDAARLIRGVR